MNGMTRKTEKGMRRRRSCVVRLSCTTSTPSASPLRLDMQKTNLTMLTPRKLLSRQQSSLDPRRDANLLAEQLGAMPVMQRLLLHRRPDPLHPRALLGRILGESLFGGRSGNDFLGRRRREGSREGGAEGPGGEEGLEGGTRVGEARGEVVG